MAKQVTETPRKTARLRRKAPRITAPEQGSLYDIMHENAGTSLYVVPILWTDTHTQLLGAEFHSHPAILTPVPDYIPGRWLEPSHIARNLTNELHTLVRGQLVQSPLYLRNRAMKHVMGTLFPATLSHSKFDVELDMYFGLRVFRKAVRIPCLWLSSNSEASFASTTTMPTTSFGRLPTPPDMSMDAIPNRPMLAYMSRGQLAYCRKHLFRVVKGPNDGPNEPVASLQRLRSKMLIPENINHDSYLVATIIAMAQAHFYRYQSSKSYTEALRSSRKSKSNKRLRMPPPEFQDVKIQIITHDEENESSPNFIVYTATVTTAFLDRFMHPHKAPLSQEKMEQGAAGLKIDLTPVSVWPILGLKERLAKALGRDLAGEPVLGDPEHIGLWDVLFEKPEPEQQPSVPIFASPPRPIPAAAAAVRESLKRRRHGSSGYEREQLRAPLSEMLDSSFEEETTPNSSADDLDRPVLSPGAKRRRTAASSRGGSGGATPGNRKPLEVC